MLPPEAPTELNLLPSSPGQLKLPEPPKPRPVSSREPVPLGSNTFDMTTGAHAALDPCAGWLIGQCEIIRRLTPGQMKSLLAHRDDHGASNLVVMKKLDASPGALDDLRAHSNVISGIAHPHLARVFACEASDEGVFWVTEFEGGATLQEIRSACKKAGKSLSLGVVFASIYEAALALGELHSRGLAHGDVTDANLLVTFSGTAKLLNPGVIDCVQQLPPDPKVDCFKLGGMLYQCLTGQALAAGDFAPPSSFNHALEPQIDAVLKRALGPDRTQRFSNGAELAKALRAAASVYMWKASQRAEFVGGLFKRRQLKEQALIATASQRIATRRSAKLKAQVLEDRAAAEDEVVLGALIEEPVTAAGEAPKPESVVEPGTTSLKVPRKLVVPIAAAAAAAVILSVVLAATLGGGSTYTPPPIVISLPAPPPPPAPVVEAAPPPVEEPPALPPPEPEKPKVKKKKNNDPPLPPWLRRK